MNENELKMKQKLTSKIRMLDLNYAKVTIKILLKISKLY